MFLLDRTAWEKLFVSRPFEHSGKKGEKTAIRFTLQSWKHVLRN